MPHQGRLSNTRDPVVDRVTLHDLPVHKTIGMRLSNRVLPVILARVLPNDTQDPQTHDHRNSISRLRFFWAQTGVSRLRNERTVIVHSLLRVNEARIRQGWSFCRRRSEAVLRPSVDRFGLFVADSHMRVVHAGGADDLAGQAVDVTVADGNSPFCFGLLFRGVHVAFGKGDSAEERS